MILSQIILTENWPRIGKIGQNFLIRFKPHQVVPALIKNLQGLGALPVWSFYTICVEIELDEVPKIIINKVLISRAR